MGTDDQTPQVDITDRTYRTRLLEFLSYEQTELEKEKARIDERLLEIRHHISAILKDKQTGDLQRWADDHKNPRRRHR